MSARPSVVAIETSKSISISFLVCNWNIATYRLEAGRAGALSISFLEIHGRGPVANPAPGSKEHFASH